MALELRGFPGPDGKPALIGKVLELEEGEKIVLQWKTSEWKLAVDPTQVSDQPSILTLEFRDNTVGAEIVLTQTKTPRQVNGWVACGGPALSSSRSVPRPSASPSG